MNAREGASDTVILHTKFNGQDKFLKNIVDDIVKSLASVKFRT